jgi:hypothetical protein
MCDLVNFQQREKSKYPYKTGSRENFIDFIPGVFIGGTRIAVSVQPCGVGDVREKHDGK